MVDPKGAKYGDLTWPPPSFAINGKVLSFSYCDEDGVVTERRVKRWKKSLRNFGCFEAYCLDRDDDRTFRIDRVQSWG